MKPLVSVVLPAYNCGTYISMAIGSIMAQTFTDFECIVVNDGSSDETEAAITACHDTRLVYLKNESNKGISYSRNKGMAAAKGKYIAIMDSDDLMEPHRLMRQVERLESNPGIGIISGKIVVFTEGLNWFERSYPPDNEYIKSYMFFRNPVAQAAAMFRRELFEKQRLKYDESFAIASDYDMWCRAVKAGVRIENLDKVLLYVRKRTGQVTDISNFERYRFFTRRILEMNLNDLGVLLPEQEVSLLHAFSTDRLNLDPEKFSALMNMLRVIEKANRKRRFYSISAFRGVMFYHRLRLLKYFYLERKKHILFLSSFLWLSLTTGVYPLWLYWRQQGRFGRSFGIAEKYTTPLNINGTEYKFGDEVRR